MLNSEKLKAMMIDRDVDAEELATRLGFHRSSVFRWMTEEHLNVAPHVIKAVANILDCEPGEIMDLAAFGIPETPGSREEETPR